MMYSVLQICRDSAIYYAVFLSFYVFKCCVDHPLITFVLDGNLVSAVHLYTLSKQLLLWDAPHYRAPSFATDLRNNLKNVAIPGTGIPLSLICHSKCTALLFVLFVNPVVSLAAACYLVYWLRPSSARIRPTERDSTFGHQGEILREYSSVAETYHELLLCPRHWFAIWRHNCLVVGYHALVTGSSSYRLEDKGVFLLEGDHLGLPVSPYLKDAAVFVKHKSIEGGMGIHVYRNFAHGGDWIIQKALSNSSALQQLLPEGAPLSTFRVVTASTAWLEHQNWLNNQPSQQCPHKLRHNQDLGATEHVKPSSCIVQAEDGNDQNGMGLNTGAQLLINHQSGVDGVQSCLARAATPPLPLSRAVLSPHKLPGQLGDDSRAAAQTTATSLIGSLAVAESQEAQAQLEQQPGYKQPPDAEPADAYPVHGSDGNSPKCRSQSNPVKVVTAVWRAGLAGAETDHACLCFNLDVDSGTLGPGVGANHWYKLGLSGLTALCGNAKQQQLVHPQTGKQVAGVVIPETPEILATVVQAHIIAAPDLPLIGWDIAVTPGGVYILEVNISCNLFDGRFDQQGYYQVLHQYLAELGVAEARQQRLQQRLQHVYKKHSKREESIT